MMSGPAHVVGPVEDEDRSSPCWARLWYRCVVRGTVWVPGSGSRSSGMRNRRVLANALAE